ncbi:serine/threonine-protein kinase [Streptomyces prasinosporus]|uniref:non-specific serine/threonine protein kinase n=1 Tax=Streptomyces prasinosporus TaxID=68256 RepID=A0ABP6U506_9ACTN
MRLRESALALASRCSAEVLAGRYRLDARIGSGGAADVHRGLDLRLRRPVAVKVFRTGGDADMEERFRSEGVILARLHHPGLVTAYDAGRHDGRAYLVMQLIEGPTLKDRIAEAPLSPEETAALGAGLARALAHAHEAGVVHRDVKPSNILLDGAGRPHLTDFGISRLLDATTRTATGTLIGTAAYLSPEQVLGRPVGRPADVYALGLVLLECLTGRLEYEGAPLEAAIARLHRQPALPGSLPEGLRALLRDMTALDDRARPPAGECARRLDALAGTAASAPVPAPAPTPSPAPSPAAAAATSLVPNRAPGRDADSTHRDPSPAAGTAGPRTAPARARTLIAGGTAALTAVVAAALVASDGSPQRGGDAPRAVSRPSAQADPPHTSTARNGTPPATSPSSTRGAPSGPPGGAATGRVTRPAPTAPGAGAAAPRTAATSPRSEPRATPNARTPGRPDKETDAGAGTRTSDARPGTAEEAGKTRTGPRARGGR